MDALFMNIQPSKEYLAMLEAMSSRLRDGELRTFAVVATPADFNDKGFYDRLVDCPSGLALKTLESVDFKDHALSTHESRQAGVMPVNLKDRMRAYLDMKVGE